MEGRVMNDVYSSTAEVLSDRIYNLIEDNQYILDTTDPWKLFGIEGFDCSDLQPTMYQVMYALERAKQRYANEQSPSCRN